jgi:oligopeptide transport system permease protein
MGVTVFYAAFLVIMTLAVDIFYVMVDPRIKLS